MKPFSLLLMFLVMLLAGVASLAADFKVNYAAMVSTSLHAKQPAIYTDGQIKISLPDGYGGRYVAGEFSTIQGVQRNHLAHLLADNTVDPSWFPNPDGRVDSLVMTGNNLFVQGKFHNIAGQQRLGLAKFNTANGQVTPWNPNADNIVCTMALSGNILYVGGWFVYIGGQSRSALAALDVNTGLATNWNPNPILHNGHCSVRTILINGNTIYIGGAFSNVGGQPRSMIAAVSATTGQVTSLNPGANTSVLGLGLSGNILYAVGSFTTFGGFNRGCGAAVDISTGLVTSWNPNAYGGGNTTINDIAILGSTIYVGGVFTNIGGQPRSYLAALNANTATPTAWNPNPDNEVYTICISGSTIYVGGRFTHVGGQLRRSIAALDINTGRATNWNPNADQSVAKIRTVGTKVYAAGLFLNIGGQIRYSIGILDSATGLATPWSANADFRIFDIALSGNTIYAGGEFRTIGGQARGRIAAIELSPSTSLQPDLNNPTLTLHPNPATTSVAISLSTGHLKQVEVLDQLGRVVLVASTLPGNSLDISGLAAGTYMVKVSTENGVATKRLAVVR